MWKCKCGAVGEENFYKSDKSTCKECIKHRVRQHRKDNIDAVREYDRNRPNAKERTEQHKERISLFGETQKKKYNQQKREWSKRNRHKTSAQNKAARAVMKGDIIRSATCEQCGATGKLHGHHPDYAKPLEIIWLCPTCHGAEHKNINNNRRVENDKS